MNLSTVHHPPETVREKLRAIRSYMHKGVEKKYEDLEKIYSALSEGKAIIDLNRTMRNCATFENGMPKLAIARADRKKVYCRRSENQLRFCAAQSLWNATEGSLDIYVDDMPEMRFVGRNPNGRSPVPGIPPAVRKRNKGRLRERYILWEVESWDMIPDPDPLLLMHLAGEYYAVLDHWELTDIEASILSGK